MGLCLFWRVPPFGAVLKETKKDNLRFGEVGGVS